MEETKLRLSGKSGVYCIRNLYTKDMYVGSAVNLRARWNLHRTNLRAGKHHSKILQHAWDKYGEKGFEFFVLGYCPPDEVLATEQFWLDSLTAKYNVLRIAGSRAGAKNSDAHNRAISEKAKIRWADPAFKAAVSAKLSAAHCGVRRPPSKADRLITAFGKTQRLGDWAVEVGMRRETIAYRLNVGLPAEDALDPKPRKKGPRK